MEEKAEEEDDAEARAFVWFVPWLFDGPYEWKYSMKNLITNELLRIKQMLPGRFRLRLSILPVMLSESSSPYDSRGGSAIARAL